MKQVVQKVAVKALIVNDQNEVLLLRKSTDDIRHAGNSGRYNLPGGKIGPGEDIHHALTREVREETGLTLHGWDTRPIFVGDWRPTVNDIPLQIIGIFFVCHTWAGDISLGDEHDRYVWAGRKSMQESTFYRPKMRRLTNISPASEMG